MQNFRQLHTMPVSKPRRTDLPVLKWYNKSEAAAAAARYKNKNANADFGRGASSIISLPFIACTLITDTKTAYISLLTSKLSCIELQATAVVDILLSVTEDLNT